MVFINNLQFFHRFILGKKGQENVFYDNLEIENASFNHKNNHKGVSPWFWLSQLECCPYLSLLNVVLCDNGLSVTA